MSEMNRRDALKALAVTSAATVAGLSEERVLEAREVAHDAVVAELQGQPAFRPRFFTAAEYATLRVLVDDIIPRDERSGSATDAGVPPYIDFLMADETPAGLRQAPTSSQNLLRGGLRWLDVECARRFDGRKYAQCTAAQRHQVLDDIAWPKKAKPGHSHGVAFFTRVRDLTASGFFSSKLGVQDLRYTGNAFQTAWTGCPAPVLRKLGLDG